MPGVHEETGWDRGAVMKTGVRGSVDLQPLSPLLSEATRVPWGPRLLRPGHFPCVLQPEQSPA